MAFIQKTQAILSVRCKVWRATVWANCDSSSRVAPVVRPQKCRQLRGSSVRCFRMASDHSESLADSLSILINEQNEYLELKSGNLVFTLSSWFKRSHFELQERSKKELCSSGSTWPTRSFYGRLGSSLAFPRFLFCSETQTLNNRPMPKLQQI